MRKKQVLGDALPYLDMNELSGNLIVIEGTDGVGRSTQVEMLKEWLEVKGYGVITTGWTQSALMSPAIEEAKRGHTLNVNTYSLLYAADFADRFEHIILPALKGGFIVLADRYIYTAIARAIVRGSKEEWIRGVYGFALIPDLVVYLKISPDALIPRVINREMLMKRYWEEALGEGLDYWESGMDLKLGEDFYESFLEYQKKILAEFDRMAREHKFKVVDATKDSDDIHKILQKAITPILSRA